jgi:two-component system CheB/CheR fusion protein
MPVRVEHVAEVRPVDDRPVGLRLQRLLQALPSAVMFIDAADTVLVWNPAAESLFELAEDSALGRKFRDLDVSYRVEGLRARVEEVKASHIPARLDHVSFTRRSGGVAHVDLTIVPVIEDARLTAVAVYGVDATETAHMKEQMARITEQHAGAVEELQSTNEELETTNEELQSTNEELETTNEELQSTNEELETTVQELQATNDELANVNAEMARRTAGQRQIDDYQHAVMSSFPAVVALDVQGVITTWNDGAERLWGLPAADVTGRPFWSLPVGDGAQKLREALGRVTSTGVAEAVPAIPFTLPRTSERRVLSMQVTPLRGRAGDVIGAVGLVLQNNPE